MSATGFIADARTGHAWLLRGTNISLAPGAAAFGANGIISAGDNLSRVQSAFDLPPFGTSDFCVEGFIDVDATQPLAYPLIASTYPGTGSNFLNGQLSIAASRPEFLFLHCYCALYSTSERFISTSINTKGAGRKHFALARSGDNFYLLWDGVVVGTRNWPGGSVNTVEQPWYLLGDLISTTALAGDLDELRITLGTSRGYTTTITPPTAAFDNTDPDWDKVIALVHAESLTEINAVKRSVIPSKVVFPVTWPVTEKVVKRVRRAVNVFHGGLGYIEGTVKVDGTPDYPVAKRVRLFRDRDAVVLGEMYSDAITGLYRFDWLDMAEKYTVIATDEMHSFRAEIADNLTPDLI